MSLYTNLEGKYTIRNAFYKLKKDVSVIYIASPYFTYNKLINELADKNIMINLLVCFSSATSPNSLRKIIDLPGVSIRYFTSQSFHSKLYIFGNNAALVGSANFTEAGLNTNTEICVQIGCDNEMFDELLKIFNSYWNQYTAPH